MTPETILSGLVDYRRWARTYEGPYSRACKLGVLNVLGADNLCRMLFGRGLLTSHAKPLHGRSLLGGAWLRETGKQHQLACSVATSSLDKMCGPWAQWIASDAKVRYCPECMRVGFQSVVHQIDGLNTCPLHGSALLDTCQDCGHPMPPYAVTRATLDTPLCCSRCGSPFSKAWEADALRACREAPFDERPFAMTHSWLRRLGGLAIEWPELTA
ncbi:hypothetical protein [Acidovorax sp. NCPPB 3576]|uniref:hypothetical protein n=1 Tax=Acidovorax sp. NCPPB 3576 TaxID=2940488 RepID=UPI00234BA407|nr:hypothetical protein [Acidovorax sp. NCPPB 3576]WCM90616.1 DUF2321 domain-containing protein [Acidovorax sp. NCPPB 3576]